MGSVVWPSLQRSLVAIIRGIRNDEVEPVLEALITEGFEVIEIPLNSPEPWVSIEKAVKLFGDKVLIGAGTVLTTADAQRLADIGGRIMVSPNTDAEVIRHASSCGLITMPGCYTASEALLAIRSGASALKFFPAGSLGASGIAAIKTILPENAVIGAVGGVSDQNFGEYARAGIRTFGIGSSLYKPGDSAETVRAKARLTITAYDQTFGDIHG
ncbi:2-dehydro-3-deoxy-6-phosphogalactonate aldolase [Pseudochrobactrum asaccharolyticum]|jgi:2-dehydro-3-deoxyphosphogalactonate aldolase|uniref:2-keto-3-deoxy-phosphogalactonate aldolase n=1 Tax=Pseudochrobactrum asaccharolyticum TaxID=354351 RepID=A0A366E2Q5_9HYPH|nr:2-dehydro-3-deoxy-6-phosphogalactonate aldolase [Pseudochrobactrum asaccharolyticum]MDR2310510.1 2-dehydro-3-deoxy-6-phosphogalactonate aldolase [Brucellaceae bacterium]RBO95804.1 2-keto-3-deoxy-phosphogalactonate aldolase [Pseudochrobactrum asaccharolyticum]